MKTLLYGSLVKSKLIYGIETIKMTEKEVKANLTKFESTIIKRSFNLSYYCKTTPLMYALNLTPINLWVKRRKIFFILQLLKYEATKELILDGYTVKL